MKENQFDSYHLPSNVVTPLYPFLASSLPRLILSPSSPRGESFTPLRKTLVFLSDLPCSTSFLALRLSHCATSAPRLASLRKRSYLQPPSSSPPVHSLPPLTQATTVLTPPFHDTAGRFPSRLFLLRLLRSLSHLPGVPRPSTCRPATTFEITPHFFSLLYLFPFLSVVSVIPLFFSLFFPWRWLTTLPNGCQPLSPLPSWFDAFSFLRSAFLLFRE